MQEETSAKLKRISGALAVLRLRRFQFLLFITTLLTALGLVSHFAGTPLTLYQAGKQPSGIYITPFRAPPKKDADFVHVGLHNGTLRFAYLSQILTTGANFQPNRHTSALRPPFVNISWQTRTSFSLDERHYRLSIRLIPFVVFWWTVAFALMLLRRARRLHAGRCARCAHDLRHNVSGICPECGAQVPGRTETSQPIRQQRLQ